MDNKELEERFVKLDTPSISDAMDSLGLCGSLPKIKSISPNTNTIAGVAYTVKYRPFERDLNVFYNAGNYLDNVTTGHIIIIDNEDREFTVWGDILTEVALLKQINGTVIYGAARDINSIQNMKYPLFTSKTNMTSAKNRNKLVEVQSVIKIGEIEIQPGDWIIADSSGVIVIPQNRAEEVLLLAEQVEKTENNIRNAIRSGIPLVEARKKFGYNRPWENKE